MGRPYEIISAQTNLNYSLKHKLCAAASCYNVICNILCLTFEYLLDMPAGLHIVSSTPFDMRHL